MLFFAVCKWSCFRNVWERDDDVVFSTSLRVMCTAPAAKFLSQLSLMRFISSFRSPQVGWLNGSFVLKFRSLVTFTTLFTTSLCVALFLWFCQVENRQRENNKEKFYLRAQNAVTVPRTQDNAIPCWLIAWLTIKYTNQPINQWTNWLIDWSIKSDDQINQSTNYLANIQSIHQSTNQSTNQLIR